MSSASCLTVVSNFPPLHLTVVGFCAVLDRTRLGQRVGRLARAYATKHPCHGFRRAWAALRYDERREINKKKIHRLWREEGLQRG